MGNILARLQLSSRGLPVVQSHSEENHLSSRGLPVVQASDGNTSDSEENHLSSRGLPVVQASDGNTEQTENMDSMLEAYIQEKL